MYVEVDIEPFFLSENVHILDHWYTVCKMCSYELVFEFLLKFINLFTFRKVTSCRTLRCTSRYS